MGHLEIYKITFVAPNTCTPTFPRDVYISAYSQKQALKFFYDWGRNCMDTFISLTDIRLVEKHSREYLNATGKLTIEEQFKIQQNHIYKRKGKKDV